MYVCMYVWTPMHNFTTVMINSEYFNLKQRTDRKQMANDSKNRADYLYVLQLHVV